MPVVFGIKSGRFCPLFLGSILPVLILTARERWSDKAAGFSAGANDYVTKPFETAEVLFRLRALVRRAHGHAHAHPVIRVGDISLDTHSAQMTRAAGGSHPCAGLSKV